MISRTFRLTLFGFGSDTTYIERYYATYEEAFADLTSISADHKAILKPMCDDMYRLEIAELQYKEEGAIYTTARAETLFKGGEPDDGDDSGESG